MSQLSKIIASILVVLALLLSGLALYILSKPKGPPPVPVAPVTVQNGENGVETVSAPAPVYYQVVTTRTKIKAGEVLTSNNLQVSEWPIQPQRSFKSLDELTGQYVRLDLEEGELIQDQMLIRGMSAYIQPGERAVSIPISAVSAGSGRIVPGDYVDVFFTLKRDRDQIGNSQSRLLLSKKRVLAYGDLSVDGPLVENKGGGDVRNTAVLAVPLEDVNTLLLATNDGSLRLALRAPSDEALPNIALFPERESVLVAKEELSDEELESLQNPENKAFAGDSLTELSGDNEKDTEEVPPTLEYGATEMRTVEIIRGRNKQLETY